MKHFVYTAFAFLLSVNGLQAMDTSVRVPLVKLKKRTETVRPAVFSRGNAKTVTNNADNTVQCQALAENWRQLFDGKTMEGWSVPIYGGDGEVSIQENKIVIGRGDSMTGIRYEKEFPKVDYEIQYEAQRTDGYDFFAACTFPVKNDFCTFVNGGWGGGAIGLSSIDGYDASENETSSHFDFKENVWYRFRIRVTPDKIQVWIAPYNKEGILEADRSVVDIEIGDKRLSTRMEVGIYKPLGFCTWSSEGHLRNIEYRKFQRIPSSNH